MRSIYRSMTTMLLEKKKKKAVGLPQWPQMIPSFLPEDVNICGKELPLDIANFLWEEWWQKAPRNGTIFCLEGFSAESCSQLISFNQDINDA